MIIVGVLVLLALAVFIMSLPDEATRRRKKEKRIASPVLAAPDKDVAQITARWEKHVQTLKDELSKGQLMYNKALKELAVEKVKNAKLQEKIKKEEEWLAKEQSSAGRKEQDLKTLQINLQKLQQDMDKEYGVRLKLERELNDLKETFQQTDKERKELLLRANTLESELDRDKRELIRLKRENADLTREQEEKSWVAKTEYERLEKLLKERDKELEALRSQRPPTQLP